MNLKILLIFFSICFLSSCESDNGKHLFILSGQSNMVRMNHDDFFTPIVEEEFGKDNVIIVKQAKGTQSIRRWYKDWKSPNGKILEKNGDLYELLFEQVSDSINEQKIASVTFIWMQGERDARMKLGGVYEKSLLGLHDQISQDLKRTDVNFVIGRLNDFDMKNEKWPHWVKVREIQVKVGKSNPRFGWVSTDDLNDGLNVKGEKIENDLHMSVKGYEVLGKRFAESSIQLIRRHE